MLSVSWGKVKIHDQFSGIQRPLKLYANLLVCACVRTCVGAFMCVHTLGIVFYEECLYCPSDSQRARDSSEALRKEPLGCPASCWAVESGPCEAVGKQGLCT